MSGSSEPPREGFVAGLLSDLASLFPERSRGSALLAIALLLQVAYWYFGAPMPGDVRDPQVALRSVLWSLMLFGFIPILLCRPLGLTLPQLGVQSGDVRSGRTALLLGLLVTVPLGYFAAGNPSIQLTYPWAGDWAGGSLTNFVIWAVIYALYYFSYEFFYRGFLLRGLEPVLGRYGALWLQTAASTLIHLGKPLVETVAALPAGILFGLIALRTRSLLYVTLIHLALGLSTDLFSLLRSAGPPG